MRLEDQIEAEIKKLGIEFEEVIESSVSDTDLATIFKFIQRKPAMTYVAERMAKVCAQRFNGVQWSSENNELTVYYESAPEPAAGG